MASVKGVLWQAAWKPEGEPRGVAPRREPPLPEVAYAPLQLIGGFFRTEGNSLAEGKSAKLWSGPGRRPAIQEPHDSHETRSVRREPCAIADRQRI
jgi:hypothetical protein